MRITATTKEGDIYPLDVSNELLLSDLKALLEAEIGIPLQEMLIIHNMAPINQNHIMLRDCGIQDGDMLLITKMDPNEIQSQFVYSEGNSQSKNQPQDGLPNVDWRSIQIPGNLSSQGSSRATIVPNRESVLQPSTNSVSSVESIAQHFLANPEELAALQRRYPELAEALLSGDHNWMMSAMTQYRRIVAEEERQRTELSALDPMSEEYQQKLAENIRQRNIEENMETALEYNPEIFAGRVHMLYICCKVNGQVVKALVDTGAQMTVMNVQCAQRCDIMRLLDRRYASYAFGVGRQKILGVIHLSQIQIGDHFLASSFRVLESQSHELILGLDMLKRYQCNINLSEDVLTIGTIGASISFLSEMEAPKQTHEMEEKGILEDEDREMAKAIARSDQDFASGRTSDESSTLQTSSFHISEESIQNVMTAGFTREAAFEELTRCNGDRDAAKANLLAKLLKF